MLARVRTSRMVVDVHITTQQLDLQRHDRLANPYSREDTAEDQRALIVSGVQAQQEGEQ